MDVGKTSQPLVPLRLSARLVAGSLGLTEPQETAAEPAQAQFSAAPQPVSPVQGAPSAQRADASGGSISEENLRNRLRPLVEEINSKISATRQSHIKFSIDSDLGKVVVQVVDSVTDEIIRQIPPEEILDLQKRMAEMRGILFHREG